MGLDTKTYWLTDRQSQCNFDFDFDFVRSGNKQKSYKIMITKMLHNWTRRSPSLGAGQAYDRSSDLTAVIGKLPEIGHNLLYWARIDRGPVYNVYVFNNMWHM
jgi:hypothetical protein